MRPRKEPGHAGARLREWLARWLGFGKAQRLRTETQAEALSTAYRHKLVAELHNLKTLDVAKPLDLETGYVPLQVSVASNGESHPHIGKGEGTGRKARAIPPEEALVR